MGRGTTEFKLTDASPSWLVKGGGEDAVNFTYNAPLQAKTSSFKSKKPPRGERRRPRRILRGPLEVVIS